MDVYMDGDFRIRALSVLLGHYMPPTAIKTVTQLPELLQVFLAHCADQYAVNRRLACWTVNSISPHVVSGVWTGLPSRITTNPQSVLKHKTLLLGCYIYFKTLLLSTLRVPPYYVDGLLVHAMDSLFQENNKALVPEHHKSAWAAARQENAGTTQVVNERVGDIRAVLANQRHPTQEMMRAFKAAAATPVPVITRVWRGCPWQPLNIDEVRRKLLAHHCLVQYDEFEGGEKKLELFEVVGATAGSVLEALGTQIAGSDSFFITPLTTDKRGAEIPCVLVGMRTADLWGYCRWATYHTLHAKSPLLATRGHINLYAYSPILAQLWLSATPQDWWYAVDIIRHMLGMSRLKAPRKPEILRLRTKLITLAAKFGSELGFLMPHLVGIEEIKRPDDIVTMYDKYKKLPVPENYEEKGLEVEWWYHMLDWIESFSTANEARLFVLDKIRANVFSYDAQVKTLAKAKYLKCASPYQPGMLQMQQARKKPARFTTDKQDSAITGPVSGIWQAMAVVEQLGLHPEAGVLSPVPVALLGTNASCAKSMDFPVAWLQSEYGSMDVYVDSNFGVLVVDPNPGDVCDDALFYQARYGTDFETREVKIDLDEPSLDYRWRVEAEDPQPQQHSKKRSSPSSQKPLPPNKKQKTAALTMSWTQQMTSTWQLQSSADIPSPVGKATP